MYSVSTLFILIFQVILTCLLIDCTSRPFVHVPGAKYTNETLVRHGLIGASPEKVSVAIAIRTLEAYRQMHRVCPRFSIHAFSKALCHLHNVRELFTLM
jgi:hypothetical protein